VLGDPSTRPGHQVASMRRFAERDKGSTARGGSETNTRAFVREPRAAGGTGVWPCRMGFFFFFCFWRDDRPGQAVRVKGGAMSLQTRSVVLLEDIFCRRDLGTHTVLSQPSSLGSSSLRYDEMGRG